MRAGLQVLARLLKVILLITTFLNERRLRQEGEERYRQEELKATHKQQEEAHEIDRKVARNELTDAELERMRKYQRSGE